MLPDVEVYQCQYTPSYFEEKTCQSNYAPFCTHPKGKDYSECDIKDSDLVFTLNKWGYIECNQDSDCPPAAPPSWEWNDKTKMEYGVSSITEMSINVPFCSQSLSLCEEKHEPFCGHEYGRSHPECQRCNVLTPLPEPECLDFDLKQLVDIDQCCNDLFNERRYSSLREGILQNFTITDCRLSALHLPPDASPRTSFDWFECCSFGYCPNFAIGGPLSFASAVTGIGSLNQKSLASQNSGSFCPRGHCKRPSLSRPGRLICCLTIRVRWGSRRIAICPNSCD